MSRFCPLCNQEKPESDLFCAECKKKIEREYEVAVPDRPTTATVKHSRRDRSFEEPDSKQTVADEKPADATPIGLSPATGKRKGSIAVWLLVSSVLSVAAFFYYGQTVKRSNLDKSKWEQAQKEQTVEGYLAYMRSFPQGRYYNLAESRLRELKNRETENWKKLQISENTAELRDFAQRFPQSPYTLLVKRRLDSLTWRAALNENTSESYSGYLLLSESGEFAGDYSDEARKRYELLFQSYPVARNHLDSLKTIVDGFFSALSSMNTNGLNACLAPIVFRFFDSGKQTREKIIGNLLISNANPQSSTVKLVPNIDALSYEKTQIDHYKVHLPLRKVFSGKEEKQRTVSGYIVCVELDENFRIITVFEVASGSDPL